MDQDGNVVGVVVAKLNVLRVAQATDDIAQNVNFAIKASLVANFLDANGVPYAVGSPSKTHLDAPEVAARAKTMSLFIRCSP